MRPIKKARTVSAYLKGAIRRQKDLFLPARETREYRAWIIRHCQKRQQRFPSVSEPHLLSVLTAVWDGSPMPYLVQLADSLSRQNTKGHSEWVILDNGCTRRDIKRCLEDLSRHDWIKIRRSDVNLGITAGLRCCLLEATGRYVLPIDGDDFLYPDVLQVVTTSIQQAGYPVLLYTDEDKITDHGVTQPYFKPDWDPVLLANSAYIAHLGVIDRAKALELDAYSDKTTEGSPDWDLFCRFADAGYQPVHIPEVLYSWRVHARSTADDAATKPYVFSSQRAVLERHLKSKPCSSRFSLQNSYLLPGAAHWHFLRNHSHPQSMLCVMLGDTAAPPVESVRFADYPCLQFAHLPLSARFSALKPLLADEARKANYVCFIGENVSIENANWPWEALGLFELFPDTVMIGGRLWNNSGVIVEADQHFGFGGPCGCPNRGRSVSDPGYFAQMWKQRSVSAASFQFAVVEKQYLLRVLQRVSPVASLAFGGAWVGAEASRDRQRVIYTPFLSGISKNNWEAFVTQEERTEFLRQFSDLIPDQRFYPKPFSLQKGFTLNGN